MNDANQISEHVILPGNGPFTAKDQAKSDGAIKFIGQGSQRSSTLKYGKAWGGRANCGSYQNTEVVFISAEGRCMNPNRKQDIKNTNFGNLAFKNICKS